MIFLLTLRDWLVDLLTGGEWSRLTGNRSSNGLGTYMVERQFRIKSL